MGKISISLNESNSEFAAEHGGNDIDAYVNDVMAKEQKRKAAEAELRRLLEEGEASGISDRTPHQIMDAVKQRLARDGVHIQP